VSVAGTFLNREEFLLAEQGMAVNIAEATVSLLKDTGLGGLDGSWDQLDLTKMLAKEFETE